MELATLANKSIVILGFGLEGQSTYSFLRNRFPEKLLAIADKRTIQNIQPDQEILNLIKQDKKLLLYCGDDYLSRLTDFEVIIKSPGIPGSRLPYETILEKKIILTSHLEIFFSLVNRSKTIGITGTKGKSTTTSLIYKIIKDSGLPVVLGGNIGEPLLTKLDSAPDNAIFVVELSSYQLEQMKTSPHIAVLLNVVPEHLDYHLNLQEYVQAKENIARYQTESDYLVYNSDFEVPCAVAARSRANLIPFSVSNTLRSVCYIEGDQIIYSGGKGEEKCLIINVNDIPLAGAFNRQNVLAAIQASLLAGVKPESIGNSIKDFKPLPHRLEFAGEFHGIRFFNDSISTVPECTISALEALGDNVETLLLGGHERFLDYSDLGKQLSRSHVKNLILFPPTGEKMLEAVRLNLKDQTSIKAFNVDNMQDAVALAYMHTAKGKICLLSPAAPSYGIFKDFQDRGNQFKEMVKKQFLALRPESFFM